jgi:hypothetical protein
MTFRYREKYNNTFFFSRVVDVLEETFRAKKEKKNKSKCNNINELHTHTREKDVGGIQFFFSMRREKKLFTFFFKRDTNENFFHAIDFFFHRGLPQKNGRDHTHTQKRGKHNFLLSKNKQKKRVSAKFCPFACVDNILLRINNKLFEILFHMQGSEQATALLCLKSE